MKNKMEEKGKTTKTIKMISLSRRRKKNNPKEEKTLVL